MGSSRSSSFTRAGLFGLAIGVGYATVALATQQAITVETAPLEGPSTTASKLRSGHQPVNFQEFEDTVAGEPSVAKTLTLHFAQTDALLAMSSTADFKIEPGGTCLEGDTYQAGSSCTVRLRFTPQSAGRRLGKLQIAHTASVTPFSLGLGGTAYAPVLSFVPAKIAHVTGTYPSNVGLLNHASSLAIDGGDTLYIADTGNSVVREIDSSGTLTALTGSSVSAPGGVAADTFGQVYFTEPATNALFVIYNYSTQFQLNGSGTDTCTTAAPCSIGAEALTAPTALVADPYGNLFMTEAFNGAAEVITQPYPSKFARLYDPFSFQTTANYGFSVDAYDNLYTAWGTVCEIVQQPFYDAAQSVQTYYTVAGGRTCGFSGDGGRAANAEIGATIGQIAFDLAGNLYFSDTKNNRVRRIDALTGIIHTIAGSGTTGSPSDGGPATGATLTAPTGLAVDSLGQVYIIAATQGSGTAQSVRKVTASGMAVFGSQMKGTTSAATTVTLSNTGNSPLVFTNAVFTGSNPSDFSLDGSTTSCLLTPGSTLDVGASCVVGILFKPSNTGARSANLTFLDNTVSSSNTILLSGTATLPAAKMAITAPAAGSTVTSGTAVAFKVSVTSSSGSAPTGSVTFSVDGATFGTAVTLASGAASVNLTGLTIKTHTLSAAYSGDGNYAAQTVSESVTVKAAASKSAPPPTGSSPGRTPPLPTPPLNAPGPIRADTGV